MGGKPDCDDGSMSEIIQSWQSASVGTSTRNSAGLLATNEPIAWVYSVENPQGSSRDTENKCSL
jgi:hypothetical protein